MEGEALRLVREGIALWNAADMDGIVAAWDDGIIIRPDPYFPDSAVSVGKDAARRFWEMQQETLGVSQVEILEEHDLGDRCLVHCRQHVEAPSSGVEGSFDWSILVTAREGKIVMYEFFLDRERGLAAAGL